MAMKLSLFEKWLFDYMRHKEMRLENDVVEIENSVAFRKADPVDHLEMIMAQTRLATAEQIFHDIYKIHSICCSGLQNRIEDDKM